MKFYTMGISSGRGKGNYHRIYGEGLSYANNKYEALGQARKAGWIPNPGGIWLLDSKMQELLDDGVLLSEIESSKREAIEKGFSVVWTDFELDSE